MKRIREIATKLIAIWRSFVVALISSLIFLGIKLDTTRLKRSVAKRINPIFKGYKPSRARRPFLALLILVIPLVFVFIANTWVSKSGLLTFFNRETLSTTLSDLLLVPLSLVGLVIPFFAIVVEVVLSKFGLGTIERAFLRSGIRQVIYHALGLLLFEILILAGVRSANSAFADKVGSHTFLYPVIFLIIIIWTLLVVFATGRAILEVFSTFRIQFALKLFMKELMDAGMEELKMEITRNYSFNYLNNELKDTGISANYFTPNKGKLVIGRKLGFISDISILGLKRLSRLLKYSLKTNPFTIILASPFHRVEKGNKQVAALSFPVSADKTLKELASWIVSASISVVPSKEESDKLMAAHETYKELTLTLVQQQNDDLIYAALSGYRDFFEAYIKLGIRLKAEDAPGVLSDWRAIMLINHGLNEIIEKAAREPSGGPIGSIAHWTRQTMEGCIELEDEYIFSRLLRQFQAISYYSAKNANSIGLQRSHHEPLHIFDFVLFNFGDTEKVISSLVEYRVKLANLIVNHLYTLLKQAIDEKNIDRFKEILSKLKPQELFTHSIDLPFDKWEVDFQLRSTTLTVQKRADLEDKKKSHEILGELTEGYGDIFLENVHAAAAYIIERAHNSPDAIEGSNQLFQNLWEQMGPLSQTLEWVEQYDIRGNIMGGLWEVWGDSRGVVGKDPLHVPFLLLTLRGLKEQSTQTTEVDIPALRTVDSFLEKLKQLSINIAAEKKWESIIGATTTETLQKWGQALEKSKEKYRDDVAKSIREATIEQSLVDKYRKNILDAYEETGIIKRLIVGQSAQEPIVEHPINIIRSGWPPKESFIIQDRVHYGDFGKEDGRTIGHSVDEETIKILSSNSQEVYISPNAKYWAQRIDDALSQIPSTSNSKKIIVASDMGPVYETVGNFQGFIAAHQLANAHTVGLFGEYKGTPVYLLRYEEARGFIIFDSSLVSLAQEEPIIEVRELTDEERDKSMKADPGFTEDKLRELVKVVLTFQLRLQSNNGIRVVRLIPEDAVVQTTPVENPKRTRPRASKASSSTKQDE